MLQFSNMSCHLCLSNNFTDVKDDKFPIKKCLDCGLVQVYPLPSDKAINKLYSGDYFKNYSLYLSQKKTHRKYFENKINQIKKKAPSGKLLDVGCALGFLLEEAEKQGFEALGMDISSYAVNFCRKSGLKATDNLEKLKDGQFDVVAAFEVLEHEKEPLKTAKTMFRLLKNRGLCVCSTPNYNSVFRYLMGKNWFGYGHREHQYFFSPQTLRKLFDRAGFINIVVEKDEARSFPLNYFFKRGADYFKRGVLKKILLFLAKIFSRSNFFVPFNIWENIIIYAEKP